MGETNATDEQTQFLALCEEEFKDRYTENDEDFMKLKSNEPKKPPIIDPWYNKPRRPNYDWSQQNREQGQGRRNHNSDRRYDRNNRHDKQRNYQRNHRPY